MDGHGVEGKQGEKEEELKGYLVVAFFGVGVARSGLVAGAGGSGSGEVGRKRWGWEASG